MRCFRRLFIFLSLTVVFQSQLQAQEVKKEEKGLVKKDSVVVKSNFSGLVGLTSMDYR